MTVEKKNNLRDLFEISIEPEEPRHGVPEAIKNHAPRPALRPRGAFREMAEESDKIERERAEYRKALDRLKARKKELFKEF